ncbi:MAG: class I SAM-dependent methyltransferase [Flavobacteriaceae bacterium]|nr:class I SAM-dependent methyltransferase [Flavobacteriaceae bacterium]
MRFSKFFSNVQETPWYRSLLNPVIDEITTKGKLLDIGTGTGKLIQILLDKKKVDCIGVDTSSEMILEARNKVKGTNVKLFEVKADANLPFEKSSFDYVTICNVLFHLKDESIDYILNDALSLLKNKGRIIVLTPTGNGNFLSLSKSFFSLKNLSIYIWFYATRNRAGPWTKNKYLEQYSIKNGLEYKREIVMKGFAQLEIIYK